MVTFRLNGKDVQAPDLDPHTTLLQWLRATGRTGSKEGCAEGECGACAVLLVQPAPDGEQTSRYVPVNSCLLLAAGLHGQEILTVEGLGAPGALHPVQEALARGGGSQCGYCTPGFAISMTAEYYRKDRTDFDMEAITGNLCRCTGYRPIRDAANSLGAPAAGDPLAARLQQPAPLPTPGEHTHGGATLHRPESLSEALRLLAAHDGARVVAGGTDWVVDVNQRDARLPVTVAIDHLPELREVRWHEEHVDVGAALSLGDAEHLLGGRVPLLDQVWPQFASVLIRGRATLGGNLATASPIGDMAPALLALGASVILTGPDGERTVPLDGFFTGYRLTARRPEELIRAVRVPLAQPGTLRFYKITKRPTDDISTVAAAFALDVRGGVVQSARIGLGGVAPTPVRARRTEDALVGQPWDERTVLAAGSVLETEFEPISDHRGSAAYRRAVLPRLLLKLFAETGPAPHDEEVNA